jgi:hypothetical protein
MPPLSIFACSSCAGDYEDPDRTADDPDYLPEWEGDDAESTVEGPDQLQAGPVDRAVAHAEGEVADPPNEDRHS